MSDAPRMTLELHPVGWVQRQPPDPPDRDDKNETCTLVFDPRWEDCLDGVEDFSHLLVLFWFHQREDRRGQITHVRPRHRKDMPEVGLFGTRAPVRPNPIGLTLVEVLGREKCRLRVRGLDAYHGSPILDVKGWYGSPTEADTIRVPDWVHRLADPAP